MALYYLSVQLGQQMVRLLDLKIADKAKWDNKETSAATKIQTRFRESTARRDYQKRRRQAAELQRVYRGFVGRSITAARRAQRKVAKQGLLFAAFAETIQKIWRGFNSRQKKHDYHARKEYIRTIVDKSSELQRKIAEYAEAARKEDAKRKAEKRRKLFQEKSARLGYLVSTNAQPGVYNGPYHQQPTVNGVPLEKCIKRNVNQYLKKNKLDRKKSVLKPYPRRNKMSLQSTSKYDMPIKARQRERQQNKRRWLGKKNFLGGTRMNPPAYRRGFQEGCEYIEPRELKKTSKERLAKDKDSRVSSKPFLLTSRRGAILDR